MHPHTTIQLNILNTAVVELQWNGPVFQRAVSRVTFYEELSTQYCDIQYMAESIPKAYPLPQNLVG